jgi:hypothetical protein
VSIVKEIKNMSVPVLASIADCVLPDSDSSPGGRFLRCMRDSVVDLWENDGLRDDNYQDEIAKLAGNTPEVYTYELWKGFVDLGAFREGVSDYISELPEDLSDIPRVALRAIAERLGFALFEMLRVAGDNEETV